MDNSGLLSRVHLLYLASHNLRLLIDQKIKDSNIGFNGWMLLVCIRNEPQIITQREIAQRMGLKEPSVGELIKQLMKQKLLIRAVNTHDRRKYAIKITEKGVAMYDAIHRALLPLLVNIFPEPMPQFDDLLSRILTATKGYIAESGRDDEITPPTER